MCLVCAIPLVTENVCHTGKILLPFLVDVQIIIVRFCCI